MNKLLIQRILIVYLLFAVIWGVSSDALNPKAIVLAIIAALAAGLICMRLFSGKTMGVLVRTALGGSVGADAPQPSVEESKSTTLTWFLAGLFFLTACIVILEWRQPMFFNQEDNFVLGSPLIIAAYRSALSHVFPAWNPHQFMGVPAMTNPQCVLLYPPLFLSYLVSRFVLGQEAATLDVFAIIHLFVLYALLFRFSRFLGMRPFLSILVALSVTLSGFCLILGRCWANVPPYLIFMTLLVWQAFKLRDGAKGWSWAIWTGVITGVSWYLGNAQFWVYNLMFFFLLIVLLKAVGSLTWARVFWVLPAVCLALAISAPLLVPQSMGTRGIYTSRVHSDLGEGIECGVLNMIVPAPLAKVPAVGPAISIHQYGPVGIVSRHYELLGQLYYSGTLFPLIAGLLLVSMLAVPVSRSIVTSNPLLFCGLVAFVLALGGIGVLAFILKQMPLFSAFRGPFKFLGYVNLFIVLGAGTATERYLRAFPEKRLQEIMVAIVGLGLLYHCCLPLPAFMYFSNRYTNPPAVFSLVERSSTSPEPQRVWSSIVHSSGLPCYSTSLAQNFASFYGLYTLDGYDPLLKSDKEDLRIPIEMATRPLETAREYGVRWIVVDKERRPIWEARTKGVPVHITPVDNGPGGYKAELWELPNALPMAYDIINPKKPLPMKVDFSGVQVLIPASDMETKVVVNFLYRAFFRAEADGRSVRIRRDAWDRMLVSLPPHVGILKLRYSPPWNKGFAVGALLALIGAASCFALHRLDRGQTA
jgi:hypothetical protein